MPIPWNDDPAGSEAPIRSNAAGVVLTILHDAPSRRPPTVAMAQDWHREIYRGITLPVSYYSGEVRDSDPAFPELIDYGVGVGSARGVPPRDVPAQLQRFEAAMQQAVRGLDAGHQPGRPLDQPLLDAVLRMMAIAHGEWVRIHPFANGNGRTARLWANWVAARYGLPIFVQVKPRPAALFYAGAAMGSMRGDHSAMTTVFHDMLRQYLASHP